MEAFKSNSAQDALPLTPQPSRSESIAPSDNGEQHELDSNTDVMSSIASSTDNLSIVDRCPTIAPHKLNASFHNIFPIAIIPYDEECLFSHICAWKKDVLRQGRLFITEKHFCFHSNVLGLVADALIPIKDVIQISKANSALLLSNSIIITTRAKDYYFTTFTDRDVAFQRMFVMWKTVTDSWGERAPTDRRSAAEPRLVSSTGLNSLKSRQEISSGKPFIQPSLGCTDKERQQGSSMDSKRLKKWRSRVISSGKTSISFVSSFLLAMIFFCAVLTFSFSLTMFWRVYAIVRRIENSI